MRKVTFIFTAIILSLTTMAQTPQAIKYQAIARTTDGFPIINRIIAVKTSIVSGSTPGIMVYSGLNSVTTNSVGLFDIQIGDPDFFLSGSFTNINWGADVYFLKLELDPMGGFNFQLMGISQLLSVPYALYAENVANNDDADADPTNELQTISKDGQIVTLSNGGSSFTDEVNDADADPNNELQTLMQNGLDVSLSQGGGTINVADNDNDAANELQTVAESDYQVTLSQGGGSFMTGVKSYTQPEIDALTPYNGLTVHNATTNCINYYYLNNWFEACGTCTPQPTIANAGADQNFSDNTIATTLAANTPTLGTGLWTVLAGEGGIFDDATNPSTLFTGLSEVTYTLQWAIATVCDTSYDEVTVAFYTWQCGSPFTDARDSKTYNTVQIGNQCWMAQNLNVGTRIDGSSNQANNTTLDKYCYNNSDAQCDVYGGLYQWDEMMNYTTIAGVQGICPPTGGWHLPTDAEWTSLTTFLGGESIACGKMKETGTTHWNSPNTGATNSSGFTGLPGGYRSTNGAFYNISYDGVFWSSSEGSTTNVWTRGLDYYGTNVFRFSYDKGYGFSVRCMRDL